MADRQRPDGVGLGGGAALPSVAGVISCRLVAHVALVGLVGLAGAGLAGCGSKADFPDRTAYVTIGGVQKTFTLDDCGLDHETAFVVGRAGDGSVLQAVVGVRAKDHKTGVLRSTAITVTDDPASVSAFGPESWTRAGHTGTAPGTITSAGLRGSRIQATALGQPVDSHDQPTQAPLIDVKLDARCDQRSSSAPAVGGSTPTTGG